MLTKTYSPPGSATAAGTGQQWTGFHPLSILRMLWKHKLQLFLVWIVLSAITAVVVMRIPPTYEATAIILVDSQKIPDRYVTSTVGTEVEDRIASLRQQILGPTQLLKLVNQFNLYKDERKNTPEEEIIDRMSKDTKVTLERGWTRNRPGAFMVSYDGSDPRVVAQVANEIMDLFIKTNLLNREAHAEGTTEFMTDELQVAKKSLDQQEAQLAKYKLAHNEELPQQQSSLSATLQRLQLELQGNEDAINRAQQNKVMTENSMSEAESSVASLVAMLEPPAGGSEGKSVRAAAPDRPQKESDVLQARLDLLRVRYGDDHPEIKHLRAEIAQLREIESKTAAGQRPINAGAAPSAENNPGAPSAALVDQLAKERDRLSNLKAELMLTNKELEYRSNERQGILRNIKSYEARLENLPRREQEMEALMRDYQISKDNYRSLLDKKLSAEMAAEMEKRQQAEKFTPLEYARVPEVPIQPNRPALITGGCIVGLLLSLVVAVSREVKRGTLLGEWELPPHVNIMGRVPAIKIHPDGTLSRDAHWWRRAWPLALISSALITVACGIAAVYLGWVTF